MRPNWIVVVVLCVLAAAARGQSITNWPFYFDQVVTNITDPLTAAKVNAGFSRVNANFQRINTNSMLASGVRRMTGPLDMNGKALTNANLSQYAGTGLLWNAGRFEVDPDIVGSGGGAVVPMFTNYMRVQTSDGQQSARLFLGGRVAGMTVKYAGEGNYTHEVSSVNAIIVDSIPMKPIDVIDFVSGSNMSLSLRQDVGYADGPRGVVTFNASGVKGEKGDSGIGNIHYSGGFQSQTAYDSNTIVNSGGNIWYVSKDLPVEANTSTSTPQGLLEYFTEFIPAPSNGAAGAPGVDGIGFRYVGEWMAGTTYYRSNMVVHDTDSSGLCLYACMHDGVVGSQEPDEESSPYNWNLLLRSGLDGSPTVYSTTLRWKGVWHDDVAYGTNDIVTSYSQLYVPSVPSPNTKLPPEANSAEWIVAVARGYDGAPGLQGYDGMSGINLRWTGDYGSRPLTYYRSNDLVVLETGGAHLYVCKSDSPSYAPPDARFWTAFSKDGADNLGGRLFTGAWLENTLYMRNDVVSQSNGLWYCTQDNTSGSPSPGGDPHPGGKWEFIMEAHDGLNGIGINFRSDAANGEWLNGERYDKDDACRYGGSLYVCTEAMSASYNPPDGDTDHWSLMVERGEPGPRGADGTATYVTNEYNFKYAYGYETYVTNNTWNVLYTNITYVTNEYHGVVSNITVYSYMIGGTAVADIMTPAAGDGLVWDADTSHWTSGPSASALDELTDVVADSPQAGQMLVYNASVWTNRHVAISNLFDVKQPLRPAQGDLFSFDGTYWSNAAARYAFTNQNNYFSGTQSFYCVSASNLQVGFGDPLTSFTNGMLRYNPALSRFEGFTTNAWEALAGGGGATERYTVSSNIARGAGLPFFNLNVRAKNGLVANGSMYIWQTNEVYSAPYPAIVSFYSSPSCDNTALYWRAAMRFQSDLITESNVAVGDSMISVGAAAAATYYTNDCVLLYARSNTAYSELIYVADVNPAGQLTLGDYAMKKSFTTNDFISRVVQFQTVPFYSATDDNKIYGHIIYTAVPSELQAVLEMQ